MTIEGEDDVLGLRRAGKACADALRTMSAAVRPGVSTAELDAIGAEVLRRHGASSAPQKAYGFPGATCISVNDALAHGIPSRRTVLRDGDLVNIDVSAELDGYWADTGASFAVGTVSASRRALLTATRHALDDAMRVARAGTRMREIGRAIVRRARKHRLSIVRSLAGHGVGRHIHEPPSVPNVPDGAGGRLWEGLVMTIEPFLTLGATDVYEDADGWTLRTPDGSVGAQFEHTLIVTRGAPIVVTA